MASSDVVSIKVLLDIIETSKSFDELKSNLVRTLQTMQAAAQRTDIAPKGIDKAINQAKKLEKEFDRLGVEVDRDLKKIGTSFDTLDKEIVQTGQKMDRQFRANAKAALDELRENLARAVERLRALRMEPGFDPMSEKARKATAEVEKAARALQKVSNKAADLRRVNKAMATMAAASEKTTKRVQGLATQFNRLRAILITGLFAKFVKDAVQARIAMEKIQQSLVAATGTSEKAAVAFDFVRKVSIELGLNLRDSAQAFSQLAASAKGTSLEGRQLELIFEAVAKAGRVLNLSSAEIKGTIVALRQTIGKARVSAEELRRQLGDRLPGAFQIAARAMGVTTQELDKMLEKGELLAVDLLPRFADEMNRTFGPGLQQALESTAAKIGRVQTAFFEAQAAFGAGFAEGLGETLETVTERTAAMEEAFGGFGQTLGFVASIASRLFNFLNQFFAEAQAGIAIANSLLLDLVQKGLDPILVKLAEISRGFSKFADAAGFKEVAAEAEAIAIFLEETGKHLDEDTRNARAFAEAAIEVAESLGEVSEESAKLAEKAEAAGNAILEQVEALKESGDLSGEVMIDLVQQAGKAADAINELGEESRQSLEGLQKDLRDAQEEMRKTPEFIKESIDRLMEQTAAMREAGGATANEAQKVVVSLDEILERIEQLPEKEKAAFELVTDELKKVRFEWVKELTSLDDAIKEITGVTVSELNKSISALADYAEAIGKQGDITQEQADKIVEAYTDIREAINALPEDHQESFEELLAQIGDLEEKYGERTTEFIKKQKKLADESEKAARKIAKAYEKLSEEVADVFDKMVEAADATAAKLNEAFGAGDEDFGSTFDELSESLRQLREEQELLQDQAIISAEEGERLDEISQNIATVQAQLNQMGDVPAPETREFQNSIEKLVEQGGALAGVWGDLDDETKSSVQNLLENFHELSETTNITSADAEHFAETMIAALEGAGASTVEIEGALEELRGGVFDLSKAFEDLDKNVEFGASFQTEAEKAERELERVGDAAETLRTTMRETSEVARDAVGEINGQFAALSVQIQEAVEACRSLKQCMSDTGG